MKLARHCRGAWIWLAALACAVSLWRAPAQQLEEPRWFQLSDWGESIGVDAEALREDASMQGSTSTHEYASLIPLVGAHAHGAIYHPNLLSFDLSGEGGVGWARDEVRSPGLTLTRNENRDLIRYVATVDFLNARPYNGTFFASQDHTYQNYDFFNTATVDSFRYGGRAAWTTPRLNLTANAGYRDERTDSLNGITELENTYFNFIGIDKRETGSSTLTYLFDDFSNRVNNQPPLSSMNNTFAANDSETFGSRKQITTSLGGSYSEYSFLDTHNDAVNGNGNVTINHNPNLDSFGTLNYNRNNSDQVTSSVFQGIGGVRHHLYESLNSTADLHGTYDESTSPGSWSKSDRFGAGLREDYTKRIGSFGRLSLGGGVVVDHEDHDSSGTVLTTIDESHQLFLTTSQSYRPAYLNNPRVILPTIEVRGQNGVPAQEFLDYQVIPVGERVEIRLVQGSTILRSGDTVLVSYQSTSLFNASFEAINSFAQVRLDLFNTVGIYGRINSIENNAPPEVLTETLLDLVGGVEVRWRFLHAGAEYEDFDSNFSQYQAARFFQTFSREFWENATVGVEFNQLFYKYSDDRRDTQYQFIAHFNTRLTSWLTWNIEGGYFLQEFDGTEQNLGAVRTDLSFVRGQLSMKLGYQYNYQLTRVGLAEEERNRNFVYLSFRRYF